ncbi:hypothetical protein JW960_17885 [candidate division KSB1 bacterium]|nr:hypothetical protein [candidate division KSB1 bacterium]
MQRVTLCLMAIFTFSFFTNCDMSVNRSIQIANGEQRSGSLNTVNGSIMIGSDCIIKGTARSVNGSIEIGENSQIRTVQTVNGSINLGEGISVDGNVESVNGPIEINETCMIDGNVQTVNGPIELSGVEVERSINTYNGNITILRNSIIHGDIIVDKPKGSFDKQKTLIISIGDSSVVKGDIIVKAPERPVIVELKTGGRVLGSVENAEVKDENSTPNMNTETNKQKSGKESTPAKSKLPGGVS